MFLLLPLLILSINVIQISSFFLQKSPKDQRTYEVVFLKNYLTAIFIYDKYTSQAACSFSVGVGSYLDKPRSQGLAHFLQHMLFMGTQKYPEPNQYSAFVRGNGGYDNAYTSDSQTNYYFHISNQGFYEGVQRLADVFKGKALIKQETLAKEMQVVHDQFELNLGSEQRRRWEILKRLAKAPFSNFNTGNKQTLNHTYIRSDLIQFYEKYYSSNIMTVAMISQFPIQQMKQKLIPILEQIPNKNVTIPKFGPFYSKKQLGKLIKIQSIRDNPYIQFIWVIDSIKSLYRKNIQPYIGHVTGHEGKNSLLSYLKLKNLALQITSDIRDIDPHTFVILQIGLTSEGEKKYEEVYNIVSEFIQQLTPQQHFYYQLKQQSLISYQFQDKASSQNMVTFLSQRSHHVPLRELLNISIIYDCFSSSKQYIKRVFSKMRAQNLFLTFFSKSELSNPKIEPYLKAKYKIFALPVRKPTRHKFQPMPPNTFTPVNTTVLQFKNSSKYPYKIGDSIYFYQASTYEVCKGGIQIRIYTEQNLLFVQFYTSYLRLLLREIVYPAIPFQTKIDFSASDCLIITIFGYRDVVHKMLQNVAINLFKLHTGTRSQILFEVALKDLKSTYDNYFIKNPDSTASYLLKQALIQGIDTVQKTIEQLKSYSYQSLTRRIRKLWNNNYIRWVVVGNFDQKQTIALIQNSQSTMRGKNKYIKIPQYPCLNLNLNLRLTSSIIVQKFIESPAWVIVPLCREYSEEMFYKLTMMKVFVTQPYYNQLRNNRQMAYSLGVRVEKTRGILGLKFYLVSSTREPKNISDEIKAFVNQFFDNVVEKLEDDNYTELIAVKQGMAADYVPYSDLQPVFDFLTSQIGQKKFNYDRNTQQNIHKYLDDIQPIDLKKVWQRMKNKTVEVYVISQKHKQEYKKRNIIANSTEQIKKQGQFWKDLYH